MRKLVMEWIGTMPLEGSDRQPSEGFRRGLGATVIAGLVTPKGGGVGAKATDG